MYDILKAYAEDNGWYFDYGRSDYHNLFSEEEKTNTPYLFLDPIGISKVRNDSGVIEKTTHTGLFMLLLSSDIDEVSYEDRYEKYIRPVLYGFLATLEEDLICNHQATLEKWESLEVVNAFDYNLDGVIITFSVSINE